MIQWIRELSLPNKLSLARIVLIPLLVFLMISPNRWSSLAAAIVFLIAALTDWLDGHLARKQSLVSKVGRILDPVADKLLVVAALIMLVHLDHLSYVLAIILIGREIAVNALRGLALEDRIEISVHALGKYKTAAQSIAICALILGPENAFFGIHWFAIGQVFIWLATILSLVSATMYFGAWQKTK
jgi:CDP-diacylglycerol--glycerol-3-phosphate 3-phosphatidyltransferase